MQFEFFQRSVMDSQVALAIVTCWDRRVLNPRAAVRFVVEFGFCFLGCVVALDATLTREPVHFRIQKFLHRRALIVVQGRRHGRVDIPALLLDDFHPAITAVADLQPTTKRRHAHRGRLLLSFCCW